MQGPDLPECLTTSHAIQLDSPMSMRAFQAANDFHDGFLRKITIDGDEAKIEIDNPYFIPWGQYGLANIVSAIIRIKMVKDGVQKLASKLADISEREIYSIACNSQSRQLEIDVDGTYDLAIPVDFGRSTLAWSRSTPSDP